MTERLPLNEIYHHLILSDVVDIQIPIKDAGIL